MKNVKFQFFLFLLSGSIAAILNFISRIFYNIFFNFSFSMFLAQITGMIVAYLLYRFIVFKERNYNHNPSQSIIFFMVVNGISLVEIIVVSNAVLLYLLPKFVGIVEYKKEISHAIGISCTVFVSFFAHKFITFK